MSDISTATVGTKLCIPEECGRNFFVREVTEVTGKRVKCGGSIIRKDDGLIIGSGGRFGSRYARIATDADMLNFRVRIAQSMVHRIKVTEKNVSTVEALIKETK